MRAFNPGMSTAEASTIAGALGVDSDRRTLRLTAEKEARFREALAAVDPVDRAAIVSRIDAVFSHGPLAAVSIDDVVPESVGTLQEFNNCFGGHDDLRDAALALVNVTTYSYVGDFSGAAVGLRRVEAFEGIPYRAWHNNLQPLFRGGEV